MCRNFGRDVDEENVLDFSGSAQWSRGGQCATERSNRRLWAVPKGFGQYLRALGKYLRASGSTQELWAVKAISGHSFAPPVAVAKTNGNLRNMTRI
jgi:hypothetical protein